MVYATNSRLGFLDGHDGVPSTILQTYGWISSSMKQRQLGIVDFAPLHSTFLRREQEQVPGETAK